MAWALALGVAFVTIAVAELADKTQLVTISQACRYPSGPVLAGAALGLVLVTALGVLFGAALMLVLPPEALGVVAGTLFVVFGVWLLFRWWRQGDGGEHIGEGPAADPEDQECPAGTWSVFASTFGLVAIAELGDKTQLAVIALTGEYGSPVAVFVGASLALVLVSSLGVLGGRLLARRLATRSLDVVAAALFLVLGALFLLGAVLGW